MVVFLHGCVVFVPCIACSVCPLVIVRRSLLEAHTNNTEKEREVQGTCAMQCPKNPKGAMVCSVFTKFVPFFLGGLAQLAEQLLCKQ